jgi:integrase
MARVTLNSEIAQFSLKCEVNPAEWNPQAGRAIGKTASAQQLNGLLDNFRASITQHFRDISDREASVTAEKTRNTFLGLQTRNDLLLELFDRHNKSLEVQIGKDVSRDTHQKYVRTRMRLEEFMKRQYNISDINLKEINHSFLSDFEVFLKTIHSCGQNTTAKFMQRLRTVVLIAKSNGWIHADPYANYKFHREKTERDFLTEQELGSILQKKFTIKRLEQVRDIFTFSCFTGLAYIDVFNLRENNIRTVSDGSLWVIGKRVKTGVSYRVPLLDIPKMVIAKYKGTLPDGELLPIISNQKMNAYLKEIADICQIDKNLSFHMRRHRIYPFLLKTSKLQNYFHE